ncbi:MAG TPA: LD-carboxypeptidase [bacterium]|nr:LD-carboxypeptidase [bacterium]
MKQNKNIKVIKKKIGLFSPADFVEKAKIAKAISRLSSSIENIEFITPPDLLKKHGLFAGTDKEKIADFVYIEKQNPDIMLGVKGGYGSARLIDKIDFKKISRSPIMGYSDLTSLIIADNSETGKINYYGFLLVPDFYEKTYNRQIKLFEKILKKTNLNYEFNCEIIKTPTSGLKSVKAEISIAGCLSILSGMLGTKYFW